MYAFKLLALTALFAAPIVANAAVLADGSFQGKSTASGVSKYCVDGAVTDGGSACATSPWFGNSGVIASGNSEWGDRTSVDGGSYAFVQLSGKLLQTFTASRSGSFTLNWLDAGRTNEGAAQNYTVALMSGGVVSSLGTFTTEADQQFIDRSSGRFSLQSGEIYTLSFTGLSTEDNTSFIDNVAITAIPEPATWGLLIAGFVMVGGAMRRRKITLVDQAI